MRITHEADYAIRILYELCLLEKGSRLGASVVAERCGITQRFALKILRKLMMGGLAMSYKGMNGGYALNRRPEEISLGEVIELIDGPILFNHCLDQSFPCTRVSQKSGCGFHRVFRDLNKQFLDKLYQIDFTKFLES